VSYGSIARVNLNALVHNLAQVRKLAPKSKIMAMIKSNGYGHGLIEVAKALEADAFGVACLKEALALRKANIKQRIVVMRGFTNKDELSLISKNNLEAVIHCQEQLKILTQTKLANSISAWLKIDTGMHRLGFAKEKATKIYRELAKNPDIQRLIYIMTHLAEADVLNKSITKKQLFCFAKASQNMEGVEMSVANSAGIICWPDAQADWVRPGVMLYGVSPFADKIGADLGLQPVMTLQSKLIAVKKLKKGDKIGYGGTWRCHEDMPVGVVAIGYGDGYPWHAKNGTPVLVNGKLCKLVGRVSMDMLTVDLRNNPRAKINDPVILWGEGLPIEKIAKSANTIAYELLCQITQRVKFDYS
jgi:alanine racemase